MRDGDQRMVVLVVLVKLREGTVQPHSIAPRGTIASGMFPAPKPPHALMP
jgi:hypothetical protein